MHNPIHLLQKVEIEEYPSSSYRSLETCSPVAIVETNAMALTTVVSRQCELLSANMPRPQKTR
jgi:hypothetical protein